MIAKYYPDFEDEVNAALNQLRELARIRSEADYYAQVHAEAQRRFDEEQRTGVIVHQIKGGE